MSVLQLKTTDATLKCIQKTNAKFWAGKLARNRERDREVTAELQGMGWHVLRFWEHEIKDDLKSVIASVETALKF